MILLWGAPRQLLRTLILGGWANRCLLEGALEHEIAHQRLLTSADSRNHACARSSSSSTTRASRSHIGSVQNILITPFFCQTGCDCSPLCTLISRPHDSHIRAIGFGGLSMPARSGAILALKASIWICRRSCLQRSNSQNTLTKPSSSVTRSTFSSRSGLISRPHASHLSSFSSSPISTPNHCQVYGARSAYRDQRFPLGYTVV